MGFISHGPNIADSAQIQPGVILNSDINASAGIVFSKLEALTTGNMIVGVANVATSQTPAQVRTALGLVIGTNVQAYDADLAAIAALSPSEGNTLKYTSGAWTAGAPSGISTIFVPVVTTAGASARSGAAYPQGVLCANATTTDFCCAFSFPSGLTISSIKLKYHDAADAITGNYAWSITFYQWADGSNMTAGDDSTGTVTSAASGANGFGATYTLASTAYNALSAGNVVYIIGQRLGADASDTASGDCYVVGFEITFA